MSLHRPPPPTRRGPPLIDSGNLRLRATPPADAPGRVRRRDRHAGRHRPREALDALALVSQQRADRRDQGGPLRQEPGARSTTTTARSRSTTRSSRARRRPLEGLAGAEAVLRSRSPTCRSTTTGTTFRELIHQKYPGPRDQARPPRRQLLGRRRRRGGGAAGLAGLRQGARPEAARPHRRHRQHGRRPDADAERARCRRPARCWPRPA